MRKTTIQATMEKVFLFGLFTLIVSCGGDTTGGGTGTATPNGGGTATGTYVLSWDAVPDAAVTGYRAYFSTSRLSSGNAVRSLETNDSSVQIAPGNYGMNAGSTLYVAVSAIANDGRESPVSDEVSILLE